MVKSIQKISCMECKCIDYTRLDIDAWTCLDCGSTLNNFEEIELVTAKVKKEKESVFSIELRKKWEELGNEKY